MKNIQKVINMGENWRQSYLRLLPAVDVAVNLYKRTNPHHHYPHALLVQGVQEIIETLRRQILSAQNDGELAGLGLTPEEVALRVETWLARLDRPSLRRVINATGTVLHTAMWKCF
jgi:L-seryl-tRNA(Ser) seleniumtransferase